MTYEISGQEMASFIQWKCCPILYYPVAGKVQEICKFQVVGHTVDLLCTMYISSINPVYGNSIFCPVLLSVSVKVQRTSSRNLDSAPFPEESQLMAREAPMGIIKG